MKESELRQCATCANCGKKIGESRLPFFWRVRIERYGIKAAEVRRQMGLEMMVGGSAALARALSPDEDMAVPVMEPVALTICETCGTGEVMIAALAETCDGGGAPPRE